MALHPNSHPWRLEREALDVRALMVELEDRRLVIKEHSFHEGSWDAVFDESVAMGPLIRKLEREWGQWYCKVQALIEASNAEE